MRFFDRRIISWYAGVPAAQVAAAEHCDIGDVRRARSRTGRGTELGLKTPDAYAAADRLEPGHQLTFAEVEAIQRRPPERS